MDLSGDPMSFLINNKFDEYHKNGDFRTHRSDPTRCADFSMGKTKKKTSKEKSSNAVKDEEGKRESGCLVDNEEEGKIFNSPNLWPNIPECKDDNFDAKTSEIILTVVKVKRQKVSDMLEPGADVAKLNSIGQKLKHKPTAVTSYVATVEVSSEDSKKLNVTNGKFALLQLVEKNAYVTVFYFDKLFILFE